MKGTSALLGVVTFVAAHYVEVSRWDAWFGGAAQAPWFLNDGNRAALFMMACVFMATVAAGALWARSARDAIVHGVNLAAGAVTAMIVVLFRLPGGAGTLLPIAIAIGAAMLLGSALIASVLVGLVKSRSPRSI